MIELSLSVQNNVDDLVRDLSRLERDVVPQVTADTMNQLLKKANTQVKRQAVAKTGVAQKYFKNHFKVFKASKLKQYAKHWIGLTHGASLTQKTLKGRANKLAKNGIQVLSKPFDAVMRSGKQGTFVRVNKTGSRRASKRRTAGRPGSSSPNLPIVNLDEMKVYLPEDTKDMQRRTIQSIFRREFANTFTKRLDFRLRQRGFR